MTTEQGSNFSSRTWSSHPRPEIYTGRRGDFRSVEELAPVFRGVFHEFTQFNEIQSLVMDDMLYTDKSLVVSAPTGSGKTAIFELAMVRLLMKMEDDKYDGDFRMIYIAPIKALCTEKFNDWKGKFDRLGIRSAEVTGDTELRDFWDLPDCNLILTTPEKWNSITRRWRQNVNFVRLIKLVMIDEVHILNDQYRGPVLEAVVSRMRGIHRFIGSDGGESVEPMRIIALSATAPNVADLAAWVGDGSMTCFYNISESRRPIKIDKHVLGYNCDPNTTPYRFDLNLNYKLFEVIAKYSSGRPSLIFCSTRKATETASNHLVEHHSLRLTPDQKAALQNIADQLQNGELRRRVLVGIAYHHAGLSFADRQLIEDSFRAGRIPVLCCTSGLAMGVNLPAHLVVIKSTQMYTDYGMEEYPESSIFQMIGRAGRPQFDTFGVAVIMTQRENVQMYQRLATGSVPIESYLHEHLAEHLNSEIVLQTITDLGSAMDWIRSTFLYVRALVAPACYGLPPNLDKSQIEQKLEELCLAELNALGKYSLIVMNAKDQGAAAGGMTISSTLYGRLMAQYCLNFRTVKLLRKIKGTEPLLEMFTLLTYCDEFAVFKCRNSAKRTLNELNRSKTCNTIRFPLRGRIQTTTAMASCLIQAVFGNLPIEDGSLQQEATKMINVGRRLIKCMAEFIYVGQMGREDEEGPGVYQALLSTLILGQCLETKLWENSPYITKQLKGIGAVYAGQLAARGKISFQELMDTDPRELEVILKKNPPFGSDLTDFVRTLPIFSIDLVLKQDYVLEVTVVQKNNCYNKQLAVRISILVGDSNNNVLFFKENCDANPGGSCRYQESFKITDATVASATGHVICFNWTGLDCTRTIVINEETASSLVPEKQRTRKVNNDTASKKITEFYRKEDPKAAEVGGNDRKVDRASNENTKKIAEVIQIEDSPKRDFLESFRFTQKPKLNIDKENDGSFGLVRASSLKQQNSNDSGYVSLQSLNSMNQSTQTEHTESIRAHESFDFTVLGSQCKRRKMNETVVSDPLKTNQAAVELEIKTHDVDDSPEQPKKLNFFSQPNRLEQQTTAHSPLNLAPFIPDSTPRYKPSNRMQYFTEMHRKNPFMLFGRPQDFAAQQERQRSSVRRICLFGVFSEMPRNRNESLSVASMAAGNNAEERKVFRSMYSVDGDNNGLFYRKNYHHSRQGRRELDLGIDEFLSSSTEQQASQKENFFLG
ncbi:probable ATP-dependent DNA helicase HFM1 [Ochlerotatus camptorhynchus]|uniref:probable ATP-dependent DNA helicase HFM1 n=1 Tax=Ochlerotatus camptorhynchus TaxID=644619 RepID=UPI0031D51FE4